jgi:hypothetical protein
LSDAEADAVIELYRLESPSRHLQHTLERIAAFRASITPPFRATCKLITP